MSALRLLAVAGLGTLLFSATAACNAGADDTASSSEAQVSATGVPGLPDPVAPPPPPICGGIGGLQCPSGFDCKLESGFADALGTCEKAPIWDVCSVDSDCIAVQAHGCCTFWDKEAVHKDHVAAYDASWSELICAAVACAPPHPDLLAQVKAPLCVSNRCAMVKVEAIACGGHSPNPHACPAGYDCEGAGLPVDAPGSCEKK